jgi:hypothetical protein
MNVHKIFSEYDFDAKRQRVSITSVFNININVNKMKREYRILIASLLILLLATVSLAYVERKFQINLRILLYAAIILNAVVVSRMLVKKQAE